MNHVIEGSSGCICSQRFAAAETAAALAFTEPGTAPLVHGSADAWEQIKKGLAESYETLSKQLEDAMRELRGNRQPDYRNRDDVI